MPIPGSEREKKLLQEIAGEKKQPEFLQEIKEPRHEEVEVLQEQPKKRRTRRKRSQ